MAVSFLRPYERIGRCIAIPFSPRCASAGLALGGASDGSRAACAERTSGAPGLYAAIAELGAPLGFVVAASCSRFSSQDLSESDFLDWVSRYPFFSHSPSMWSPVLAPTGLVVTDGSAKSPASEAGSGPLYPPPDPRPVARITRGRAGSSRASFTLFRSRHRLPD